MEPKFQTSFIPKKPIIDAGSLPSRSTIKTHNIFSTAASLLFVVTLFATGGVFIYKNIIINQIAQADKDLDAARKAFEVDKIQGIIDANSRIMATKGLLERHVVVSQLLMLIQTLTLKRMRLTDLTYSNKSNQPTISIDAEVQTYNALAEQSLIFSKNEFIQNPSFSDFQLIENGNVKLKFFAALDPRLTSYKKAVESLSLNQ